MGMEKKIAELFPNHVLVWYHVAKTLFSQSKQFSAYVKHIRDYNTAYSLR